jgi:hypothetical protein
MSKRRIVVDDSSDDDEVSRAPVLSSRCDSTPSPVNADTASALTVHKEGNESQPLRSSRRYSGREDRTKKHKHALNSLLQRSKKSGLGALDSSDNEGSESEDNSSHDDESKIRSSHSKSSSMRTNAKRAFLDRFEKRIPFEKMPDRDGDDDMANFIVDSDEEEESGEDNNPSDIAKSNIRSIRSNEGEDRTGSGDDDDDDDEAVINVVKSSSSRKKRKKRSKEIAKCVPRRRSLAAADDKDENEGSDDDNSERSLSGDDESLEGPALYWQVDALLDRKREERMSVQSSYKSHYTRPEAMKLYIEMLAVANLLPEGLDETHKDYCRFSSAAKQVEDLICTTRESLLGSGAWRHDFVEQLQSRPFYSVSTCSSSHGSKCQACGRGSHNAVNIVFLYGNEYNARKVWTSSTWANEMPAYALLCDDDADSDSEDIENDEHVGGKGEGDDSSVECLGTTDGNNNEEKDSTTGTRWWLRQLPQQMLRGKESKWFMGSHCTARTQLYHTLLHYKFRLLYKVREKLERYHRDVSRVMADEKFVSSEVSRFETLIHQASSRWGGSEHSQVHAEQWDLWGDSKGSKSSSRASPLLVSSSSSSSSSSATSSRRGSGSTSQRRLSSTSSQGSRRLSTTSSSGDASMTSWLLSTRE